MAMFFDDEQIKNLDFGTFPSGVDFYSKGYKLLFKKPAPSTARITVGYIDYPFDSTEFIFKELWSTEELFRVPVSKNNFNIYYEKHDYIKTMTLAFPDVDKICSIMNFHFEQLLHFKVINPNRMKTFKTQDDIMKYCNTFNFPVVNSFTWEKHKGAEITINNASNMCLYPTVNNKFMIALSLRLPIKKNTMLKLFVLPQEDGSYLYGMRDITSLRKNQLFVLNDMTELFKYMKSVIFENTHYTKKIRDVLGTFTIDDYNEDNLKVYEMSKY